mgnify:CR=1 FL=1
MDINRVNEVMMSINQGIVGYKCENKPQYVQQDHEKGDSTKMMEADINKINTVQAKDQDPKIQTQKIQKKKIGKKKIRSPKMQTHIIQTQKIQEKKMQSPKIQTQKTQEKKIPSLKTQTQKIREEKIQSQKMQVQKIQQCKEQKQKVRRLAGLDTIRGITLLSMMLYHTCWDLVFLFGKKIPGYSGLGGYVWQQSICWTFILLAGFCWSLGSHHLKRGLIVFGSGILITFVTLLVMPESRVIFGVLTLIGSCMLLLIPMEKLLLKLRAEIGLVGSFLLFLLFRNVNTGYLGSGNWNILKLPDGFYENLFTTYLGFPQKGFFSADYFSLLPWFFLFLTGFYLYQLVQKNHMMEKLFSWGVPGFDVIGRHSLLIYLLHQPVVFGISWMLFQI